MQRRNIGETIAHFYRDIHHVAASRICRRFSGKGEGRQRRYRQGKSISSGRTSTSRGIRCQRKRDLAGIIDRWRIGSIQIVGIGGKCTAGCAVVPGAVRATVDDAAQRSIGADANRLIKACIGSGVGAAGGGIDRNIKRAGIRTAVNVRVSICDGVRRAIKSSVTIAGHAGARERAPRRQGAHSGQVKRQVVHTYGQVFRTVDGRLSIH